MRLLFVWMSEGRICISHGLGRLACAGRAKVWFETLLIIQAVISDLSTKSVVDQTCTARQLKKEKITPHITSLKIHFTYYFTFFFTLLCTGTNKQNILWLWSLSRKWCSEVMSAETALIKWSEAFLLTVCYNIIYFIYFLGLILCLNFLR